MKYADLHVHTHYSDSTFSPEEVIECARKRALDCIAICDHDCIDGVEPCRKLGMSAGVEVIPGIEFSCEKGDAEIHMLGYFVGCDKKWFSQKLKDMQAARIERIYTIAEKLRPLDINIDPEEVLKIGGKSTVSRLHVARILKEMGQVKTIGQAFERYIGFGKPGYVSSFKLTPEDAIDIILKSGGVPVMAHPFLAGHDEYIEGFIDHGLKGLEVYHSDHRAHVTKHYEKLAKEYGLIMTGGSDCHGNHKGRILMGTIRVPYTIVDQLRDAAA